MYYYYELWTFMQYYNGVFWNLIVETEYEKGGQVNENNKHGNVKFVKLNCHKLRVKI